MPEIIPQNLKLVTSQLSQPSYHKIQTNTHEPTIPTESKQWLPHNQTSSNPKNTQTRRTTSRIPRSKTQSKHSLHPNCIQNDPITNNHTPTGCSQSPTSLPQTQSCRPPPKSSQPSRQSTWAKGKPLPPSLQYRKTPY